MCSNSSSTQFVEVIVMSIVKVFFDLRFCNGRPQVCLAVAQKVIKKRKFEYFMLMSRIRQSKVKHWRMKLDTFQYFKTFTVQCWWAMNIQQVRGDSSTFQYLQCFTKMVLFFSVLDSEER